MAAISLSLAHACAFGRRMSRRLDTVTQILASSSRLLRNQAFILDTAAGPTRAAPDHHAICTPTKTPAAIAVFSPTENWVNGIANSENHRTPESKIKPKPTRAAVRLDRFGDSGSGVVSVMVGVSPAALKAVPAGIGVITA